MKKHYAWIICAVGLLIHFCNCGLSVTSFSVYLPLIRDSIGLTNTQTSIITFIRCLSSMLAMFMSGYYYKKFSLRQGVTIATALEVIGCFAFSKAAGAMGCYVAAVFLGCTFGFGAMIPIAILMGNWFESKRSTAMAICTMGSSVSTIILSPVVTALYNYGGLKFAFSVEMIFLILCTVIFFLLVRDNPSDKGLEKYYEARLSENKKKKKNRESIRGINYIMLLIAILILGLAGTPVTANLTIHFVTAGYTQNQAALVMSIYGAVMLAGKFIFGIASDKFGTYKSGYFFVGCYAAACFVLTLIDGKSMPLLILAGSLIGIGCASGGLCLTYWTTDFTSEEEYAARIRRHQTLFSVGSVIMTPAAGIIADITGSYARAYAMFGAMLLAMFVIIQVLYVKTGGNKRTD